MRTPVGHGGLTRARSWKRLDTGETLTRSAAALYAEITIGGVMRQAFPRKRSSISVIRGNLKTQLYLHADRRSDWPSRADAPAARMPGSLPLVAHAESGARQRYAPTPPPGPGR